MKKLEKTRMDRRTRPRARVLRRREGFRGQHLVVLPDPIVRQMGRDPLLGDLFPTATGYFPEAPGHWVERPAGLPEQVIIRVVAGRGWVQAGGERRAAGAGSFLLLPAGAPHAYGADEAEPWSVQWIHFRGRAAAAFMSWARGSGAETVLPTDPIWAEKLDFSPVYEVLEQDYTRTSLLVAAARLRSLLTKLPGARDRGGASSAPEVVARALAWMRRNPGERLRPVRMAREAGWSETHFRGVFKAATGYPPLEYFLRLKVQRACQLLDTTELRIGEVAAALGWSDAFYFSRQFRRITGQSPRGYRKVVKS